MSTTKPYACSYENSFSICISLYKINMYQQALPHPPNYITTEILLYYIR